MVDSGRLIQQQMRVQMLLRRWIMWLISMVWQVDSQDEEINMEDGRASLQLVRYRLLNSNEKGLGVVESWLEAGGQ